MTGSKVGISEQAVVAYFEAYWHGRNWCWETYQYVYHVPDRIQTTYYLNMKQW